MVQQVITKGYNPQKALAYFEELCKIPHGSGNEEAVAKYIENFAKKRGLFVIRDKNNNVFIRKEATAGYENAPAYLLQGHTDMVCAKLTTSTHDFEKDALDLYKRSDIQPFHTCSHGRKVLHKAYGEHRTCHDLQNAPPHPHVIEASRGQHGEQKEASIRQRHHKHRAPADPAHRAQK